MLLKRLQTPSIPNVGLFFGVLLSVVQKEVEDFDHGSLGGWFKRWFVTSHQLAKLTQLFGLVVLSFGKRNLLAAETHIPRVIELSVPRLFRSSHGNTLR